MTEQPPSLVCFDKELQHPGLTISLNDSGSVLIEDNICFFILKEHPM